MSFIEVNNVFKSFGDTHVLRGCSFNLQEKEQSVIWGASGSGKSTLLYLLGGLDRPDSGEIHIQGSSLESMEDERLAVFRNRLVGFVFQFHFLLPSMTCRDNILLPARIGGVDLKAREEQMKELGQHLGVSHCLDKMPYQLSGGEQQRVNIIRALSLRPKLLLCDEPTGNLDSKNSEKVTTLLKELADEFESTLIVVTHDAHVANRFSRKIVIEDGHIIS